MTGERFRGSSDVPLTAAGHQQALERGIQFAQKGGLDEIHTSDLSRAMHTARAISRFTHAPIVDVTDRLHPWHLGSLEGQPVTPELIDLQKELVKDRPDHAVPGRGPLSIADGESFNQFKQRTLGKVQELLQRTATHPELKIGAVTHYRVKKIIDSWLRAGAQPDGTTDAEEMNRHDKLPTAGVDRLSWNRDTGPEMSAVDMTQNMPLPGGIYLIRHGETAWNNQQS